MKFNKMGQIYCLDDERFEILDKRNVPFLLISLRKRQISILGF